MAALQDDRWIVLEAVKQHGYALRYASVALKDDRWIVLEAAKQKNMEALLCASFAQRDDLSILKGAANYHKQQASY